MPPPRIWTPTVQIGPDLYSKSTNWQSPGPVRVRGGGNVPNRNYRTLAVPGIGQWENRLPARLISVNESGPLL